MGRIGVDLPVGPETTSPHGESRQTSLWSFVTKESRPTDSGRQADMTAAATLAGAAPDTVPGWHAINWHKVRHNVRRLQARIVKAIQEGR